MVVFTLTYLPEGEGGGLRPLRSVFFKKNYILILKGVKSQSPKIYKSATGKHKKFAACIYLRAQRHFPFCNLKQDIPSIARSYVACSAMCHQSCYLPLLCVDCIVCRRRCRPSPV